MVFAGVKVFSCFKVYNCPCMRRIVTVEEIKVWAPETRNFFTLFYSQKTMGVGF